MLPRGTKRTQLAAWSEVLRSGYLYQALNAVTIVAIVGRRLPPVRQVDLARPLPGRAAPALAD